MISSKLNSAAAAPATLLSLRRSGMAGLDMARLTGRFDRVLEPVVLPGAPVRATAGPVAAPAEVSPTRTAASSLLRA